MHSGCNSKELDIRNPNHGNNFVQKAIRNINPFEKEQLGIMSTEKHSMNLYKIPNGTKHGRDCAARTKVPYLGHDMYQERSQGNYNMVAEKLNHKLKKCPEQPRGRGYSVERNLVSFEGNNGGLIGSGGIGFRNPVDSPGGIPKPSVNKD